MKKVYRQTCGVKDWQEQLADPTKHWRRERSAFELATSWELAAAAKRGLPTSVAAVLDEYAELRDAKLLLALPEHKVALEGKGWGSQTDLWALLKGPQGQVSMAVEGKAGEKFDSLVGEWLVAGKSENSPANRKARLDSLCDILCICLDSVDDIRYQLLHRTAVAIL